MSPLDDRGNAAIDRLVAGSLDDPERRELLLKLDEEPDAWRRCALAFLEDQAWRGALGEFVAPARSDPSGPDRPIPRHTRSHPIRWAVAASALAATFAAGYAAGGSTRSPVGVEVAQEGGPKSADEEVGATPIREVGWVDLVDPSAGEAPPHRVPILSGPGQDDAWLREQGPTVPEYVRAQWERKGYQVEGRRKVVSVVLDDGRRVAIPFDEVAVEYVGQPPS